MKKIIIIISFFTSLLLIIVLSKYFDRNKPFTGYLVAKDYTAEHMSNECEKTITYESRVPFVSTRKSSPRKVDAKWVWFIANKNRVIQKSVSQQMFNTKKCGDKVTINTKTNK